MNVIDFENGQCKKIRSYLDSYINNELLVETNHEVLKHLDTCPRCADELEARERVKKLLQAAVRRETAPAHLREKIQKDIRGKQSLSWPRWTLAAAAALVLIVGAWGVARLIGKGATETSAIANLHPNAEVLKIGLGDHIHCALDSGFANKRLSAEEMAQKMGPDFAELVPILKQKLPADYEMVAAHKCFANKREFRHVVLRNGDKVFSLVITRKNGEAFLASDLAEVAAAGGVQIFSAALPDEKRSQQLEVAGFESRDFLAYIVSNAQKEENLQIASSLAPAIKDFLARREA